MVHYLCLHAPECDAVDVKPGEAPLQRLVRIRARARARDRARDRDRDRVRGAAAAPRVRAGASS
jgi:hypothetical protein